ncbi:hypothetical protein AXF42_Ash007720 [Apostasia shenzhenica]|uniref:Uncharacterized protein n=1 Tax=Apostasia shenzhenica TaxID=1088818 RepID=A0A2I0B552_9ASPA|nr:hypothetical protein AXF42_Ash007720 [Apostasia shenzhenica]
MGFGPVFVISLGFILHGPFILGNVKWALFLGPLGPSFSSTAFIGLWPHLLLGLDPKTGCGTGESAPACAGVHGRGAVARPGHRRTRVHCEGVAPAGGAGARAGGAGARAGRAGTRTIGEQVRLKELYEKSR